MLASTMATTSDSQLTIYDSNSIIGEMEILSQQQEIINNLNSTIFIFDKNTGKLIPNVINETIKKTNGQSMYYPTYQSSPPPLSQVKNSSSTTVIYQNIDLSTNTMYRDISLAAFALKGM